jgi:hypothetical protein
MLTNKNSFLLNMMMLALLLLAGCSSPVPPVVSDISAQIDTKIPTGQELGLSVQASGKDLTYEWKTNAGTFTSSTTENFVVYRAPGTPQVVTVSVTVTGEGGLEVTKTIDITVFDNTPIPTTTPTTMPTATPTFTPTPTIIPTQTLTPTLTPQPCAITNLDWVEHENQKDQLGSSISVEPSSETKCALKISFDLKPKGWIATYKSLNPDLISQTEGIRFSYNGTGAPNTLELKLIEKDGAIFEIAWNGETLTNEESRSRDVRYSSLKCRLGSANRCSQGAVLAFDPANIDRIDITFSNHPEKGDIAGQGNVVIEWIQTILP